MDLNFPLFHSRPVPEIHTCALHRSSLCALNSVAFLVFHGCHLYTPYFMLHTLILLYMIYSYTSNTVPTISRDGFFIYYPDLDLSGFQIFERLHVDLQILVRVRLQGVNRPFIGLAHMRIGNLIFEIAGMIQTYEDIVIVYLGGFLIRAEGENCGFYASSSWTLYNCTIYPRTVESELIYCLSTNHTHCVVQVNSRRRSQKWPEIYVKNSASLELE